MPRSRKRSSSCESDDEVKRQIKRLTKLLDKRAAEKATRQRGPDAGAATPSSQWNSTENHEMQVEDEDAEAASNFAIHDDYANSPGISEEENAHLENVEEDEGQDTQPLDEETLKILGYDTSTSKSENLIHKNIADIWGGILQKGLATETRNELISKYQPFTNCPLMEPPKINPEIKVTISEATMTRDARLADMQKRLCSSLSALGSVLGLLLENPEVTKNKQMIALTSDAARLLADVHHEQSQARRGLLKGVLNKKMVETLSETSVDGWLFGSNLTERIRAAKALDKTSEELKVPHPQKSAGKPQQRARTLQQGQGSLNFRRPSRQNIQLARQGGHKQSQSFSRPYNSNSVNKNRPANKETHSSSNRTTHFRR